jgi:ribulose-phosphate 3-epimerase
MRIISPSLLSADFSNISNTIKQIEDAGADRLHLDVMDGYFVPALTFGPMIIKEIRKCSQCHLETHLMIQQPHKTINQYINAGSDTIIIHLEASLNPEEELSYIRAQNVCAGIAINPETEENKLLPLLKHIDYILIMSVSPGRGGQAFMPDTLRKMENIVKMRGDRDIIIGVDGGVSRNTIPKVYETGIDISIVGSGLFEAKDISQRYMDLMNA